MSLAPGERQALIRIEERLRESDPDLAAKLEGFGLPQVARRGGLGGWRKPRPVWLIVTVAGLLLSILWAVAIFIPHSAPPRPCGVRTAQTAHCQAGSGTPGQRSASAHGITRAQPGK